MGARGTSPPHPPVAELVEAKSEHDDGRGGQEDTDEIKPHLRPAGRRLERGAERQGGSRDQDQQPEGDAPTDEPLEDSDEHKGEHARHGSRRPQPAQRLGLLPAVVVIRDEHDERGPQAGSGETRERLRGQHHGHAPTRRHENHGSEEERRRRLEETLGPKALAEFGAEQDERGNRQRMQNDRHSHRGGRGLEAGDNPTHRDRQRGEVEGQQRLPQGDDDHRQPRSLRRGRWAAVGQAWLASWPRSHRSRHLKNRAG